MGCVQLSRSLNVELVSSLYLSVLGHDRLLSLSVSNKKKKKKEKSNNTKYVAFSSRESEISSIINFKLASRAYAVNECAPLCACLLWMCSDGSFVRAFGDNRAIRSLAQFTTTRQVTVG